MRDQGLNLVKAFDGMYPKVTLKNTQSIIKCLRANLIKYLINGQIKSCSQNTKSGIWEPKFTIGEIFL